jgi:Na+-driven multidrug efflux pump
LAQQFLILIVGLSDRFLAGHFHPPEETQQVSYQAAQTTAQYLAWLITCYTVLVSVGSTALVARFIGAGNRSLAIQVTHQSLLLAVVFGLLGSMAGLLGMDALVDALQLRGDSAKFAADYLRPMFMLLVFQMLESAGIACLVGAGDTMTGFLVLAGVAVINLPLSWGLCLGFGPLPELGFVGIALGTALSHMLGAISVLAALAKGRSGLGLKLHLLRPNGDLIRRTILVSKHRQSSGRDGRRRSWHCPGMGSAGVSIGKRLRHGGHDAGGPKPWRGATGSGRAQRLDGFPSGLRGNERHGDRFFPAGAANVRPVLSSARPSR